MSKFGVLRSATKPSFKKHWRPPFLDPWAGQLGCPPQRPCSAGNGSRLLSPAPRSPAATPPHQGASKPPSSPLPLISRGTPGGWAHRRGGRSRWRPHDRPVPRGARRRQARWILRAEATEGLQRCSPASRGTSPSRMASCRSSWLQTCEPRIRSLGIIV